MECLLDGNYCKGKNMTILASGRIPTGQYLEFHKVVFEVTTLASTAVNPLINVYLGDTVLWAWARKMTLSASSTDGTIALGDGGDVDRFVNEIDTETGSVGDIIQGVIPSTSGMPYTYTADDTIDAGYTNGGTPGSIKPVIEFNVLILRAAPR
jgi:hypothetical protein